MKNYKEQLKVRKRKTYRIFAVVLFSPFFLGPWVRAAGADSSNQAAVARVVGSAMAQTQVTRLYDPSYVVLAYPGGDVPPERGVCSDVVIRAFRQAGVDLQVALHEDMKKAFGAYPKMWGLLGPDKNIDHRRVPNLMTYFKRKGKALPVTTQAADYRPGDVVAWRLPNGLYHIGLVSDRRAPDPDRLLMVHNIGAGAQVEDVLFAFEVLGHYRYF